MFILVALLVEKLSAKEMNKGTRFQTLVEAAFIPHIAIKLEMGMHSTILPPAMGKACNIMAEGFRFMPLAENLSTQHMG